MKFDVLNFVNGISRKYNKLVTLSLSLLIFLFLITTIIITPTGDSLDITNPYNQILAILWTIFTLVSFIYTANGWLLDRSFSKEVERQRTLGKPLEGVRGWDEFRSGLKKTRNFSMLVTIGSIASLVIFIVSISTPLEESNINARNFRILLSSFAISFTFITISLLFYIEYPDEVNFNPGGLIEFYEPDEFPMYIDNIMFDIFKSYLDPITRLDIESWMQALKNNLSPTFEPDETDKIRLEQAIERILLLLYLRKENLDLITESVLKRELGEIVGQDSVDNLISGKATGLKFEEIKNILERIEKMSPEPFRLVDRLFIALSDDYDLFIKKPVYFTVVTTTNPGAVRQSTGILAYFLNNSQTKEINVDVELKGGKDLIHPHQQKVNLGLDTLTDPYPEEQPEIISEENEDIIGVLTDLLNVGDAIWFRINPNGFGYRVLTVTASSDRGHRFGTSFELRFLKSIRYYVKAYLPKLSGVASILLPVLQAYLGLSLIG